MKSYTEAEQAIIADGDLAETALKTPAFASAVNELSEQLANLMLGTSPEDVRQREKYYFIHVALRELVALLNQRVALKEEVISKADEQENE
jgi:fructose-1-phosphate kinase PfkB-like protein